MRVCVCSTIDELPVLCDRVSCSSLWFQTYIIMGLITFQNITNLLNTVTYSTFSLFIPFSFGHFCHFLQYSNPLFLSLSLCLFLPFTHCPGVCLSFLGSFFSHILRKLSLFLLSSVDSPLTVMKQHRGISEEEEDSKLHSLHYGSSTGELKKKWRAEPPLK